MRKLIELPKADLHCHLEGSARPGTMLELADKYGESIGDPQNYSNLIEFLERFRQSRALIKHVEDLARIAREFVEDTAASGGVYCEPEWGPLDFIHLEGLSESSDSNKAEEIFNIVTEALQDAADAAGIQVKQMIGFHKYSRERSISEAYFAKAHSGGEIVSVGFAGDELNIPHERMEPAIKIAKSAGLLFIPHAGEVRGPDSIKEVLKYKPDRIAHGIGAIYDPEMLERIAKLNIPFDIALSSNVRLRVVKDIASHPLPEIIAAGVPVTLNTDDKLFFGSSLLDEYENARALGLSDKHLAEIAKNSLIYSGAPNGWKQKKLKLINIWLDAN